MEIVEHDRAQIEMENRLKAVLEEKEAHFLEEMRNLNRQKIAQDENIHELKEKV